MGQRTRLQTPLTADVRVFDPGQGRRDDSADGIVVVGRDGGARGNVHHGCRCAAATNDNANGNVDDTFVNSLTTMGAHERQPFNELLCSLVTSPIFVRC
jgi:hypothetical protein